jgi:hypothetical protein
MRTSKQILHLVLDPACFGMGNFHGTFSHKCREGLAYMPLHEKQRQSDYSQILALEDDTTVIYFLERNRGDLIGKGIKSGQQFRIRGPLLPQERILPLVAAREVAVKRG